MFKKDAYETKNPQVRRLWLRIVPHLTYLHNFTDYLEGNVHQGTNCASTFSKLRFDVHRFQ